MSPAHGYAEFYRRSIEDRDAFWTEQAALVDWCANNPVRTAPSSVAG